MTNRTVVHGAIVEAASAVPIDIAVELKPGIPGLTILGIQDNAAVELRGIVRCALRAQGYTLPRNSGSIDVKPSPGYSRTFSGRIRDAGSLALPIVLGILSASGQLDLYIYRGQAVFRFARFRWQRHLMPGYYRRREPLPRAESPRNRLSCNSARNQALSFEPSIFGLDFN